MHGSNKRSYIPEQTCSFNFCTFVPFGNCALFRGICRAPATSKMELFVSLLNNFQSLTNVTKNYILDVMGVLDPSLLLHIKILFQILIPNVLQIKRVIDAVPEGTLDKKVPMTYLKRDP